MPSYKLTYFEAAGKAEAIRLMFSLAGVDFEDCRIDRSEWEELKPKTKFGQLPILEIDGKQFAQSRALVTYLAREFGYYGKNNMDALQIDEVLSIIEDIINTSYKIYRAPEAEKEEVKKQFVTVEAPKYIRFLEKMLKDNGTGYLVGDKLTVADVAVGSYLFNNEERNPGCIEGFPLVQGLIKTLYSLENIKAYVEKRKAA